MGVKTKFTCFIVCNEKIVNNRKRRLYKPYNSPIIYKILMKESKTCIVHEFQIMWDAYIILLILMRVIFFNKEVNKFRIPDILKNINSV